MHKLFQSFGSHDEQFYRNMTAVEVGHTIHHLFHAADLVFQKLGHGMCPTSNLVGKTNQQGLDALLFLLILVVDWQRRVAAGRTGSLLHEEHAAVHMVCDKRGMPRVLANHDRVAATRQVRKAVAGAKNNVRIATGYAVSGITFRKAATLSVRRFPFLLWSKFPWIGAKVEVESMGARLTWHP